MTKHRNLPEVPPDNPEKKAYYIKKQIQKLMLSKKQVDKDIEKLEQQLKELEE
jgi:chaperonin cofactor prefoldin